MIAPLILEINQESAEMYNNFRLKAMTYSLQKNTCEIYLHYRIKEGQEHYRGIEDVARLVLPEDVQYKFHYARVTDETENVIQFLRRILNEQFEITVSAEDIAYRETVAEIKLHTADYCACIDIKASSVLESELDTEFCRAIQIKFIEIKDHADGVEVAKRLYMDMLANSAPVEESLKRVIEPLNVEKYIGDIISQKAMYISDVVPDPDSKVTVCGTLSNVSLQERLSAKSGKTVTIFRAGLTDYTGSITCFNFVSESNKQKYAELELSSGVLIEGVADKAYNGTGAELKISRISYCELPKEFHEEVYKKTAPLNYSVLMPKKFESQEQKSMFDSAEERIAPYFLGKTFVVFDTETTGINMRDDRIVEIACIKIVDGKMTEYMDSFVNPGRHIPAEASKVNHITDDMVASAPMWEDVVGDIYKFCDGHTLVGHNVSFDINMLNNTSKSTHYYFENNVQDTLRISQRKVVNARNYTLGNLLKTFNIVNDEAHRALGDTVATAKLFIKLMEI